MTNKIRKSVPIGKVIGWTIWLLLLVSIALATAACGPSNAREASTPAPEKADNENGYPVQESDSPLNEAAYPPPAEAPTAEEAYPIEPLPLPSPTLAPGSYPIEEEVFAEPRFRFDLPLNAQDRVVNGQAPPNMALAIVDVSSGGYVLGVGVSGADGRFSIGVQELPDGNRVGVTFSELQPGKTYADMSREYFPHRGEGFMNIPNVGIFFDTAVVGS